MDIAHVDGVWLEHDDRAALIAELSEEQELLTKLVHKGSAVEYDLDRLEIVMDEVVRLKEIHRSENDVLYFGMRYFSEDANPGNADNLIPEGINVHNSAQFHQKLCELLDSVVSGEQRYHVAWACPRGHAKTAWLSNIFLLHQVVFRSKRYIVTISETTDVAGDFITWGRYQLKLNDRLRDDFGVLLHVRASLNTTDNKYEYITTSGTKVEAKGLQVQMRGLRHGNTRPDMFILDDLESKETTNTVEQIEKSKSWFKEEMLPALSRDGICIYLGTILGFDSLLDYVVKDRKDFETRRFAAIETFADNEPMWEEWRRIYREDSPTAAQDAQVHFDANEEAMLKGVKLLWPGFWSYYDFMVMREENGIKAFNQEYQNEPTDEERQIFKPEIFTNFTDVDIEDKELEYFGAIDIAMGKEKGDYTAIVTMARNKLTRVCYIVDLYMERVHPDILIHEATKRAIKYQYESLAVEAQMAQEFIADKLAEELQRHGFPGHTRIKKIKQRTRKELRIEALLPEIQAGRIRFKAEHKDAIEQFTMYPMHRHDDFPDAVSMCYSAASGGSAVVRTIAKRTR